MTKTLFDTLLMLQAADCAGPTQMNRSTLTRTDIVPLANGSMLMTVRHPSSGPLATVVVEPDYTITDENYAKFEAEIRELEGS